MPIIAPLTAPVAERQEQQLQIDPRPIVREGRHSGDHADEFFGHHGQELPHGGARLLVPELDETRALELAVEQRTDACPR